MVAGHRMGFMLAAIAMSGYGLPQVVDRLAKRREPKVVDEAAEVTQDQIDAANTGIGHTSTMDSPRQERLVSADERADYTGEPKPRTRRPWTPEGDRQRTRAEQKRMRKQARRVNEVLGG